MPPPPSARPVESPRRSRGPVARAVARRVIAFLRVAPRLFAHEDGPEGFSPSQKSGLLLIVERGPIPMGAIARGLGLSTPGATRIVDRLVRAGLVRRLPGPNRRVVLVAPTPAGRRAAARFERLVETLVRRALARVPRRHRPAIAAYYEGLEAAALGIASSRVGPGQAAGGRR